MNSGIRMCYSGHYIIQHSHSSRRQRCIVQQQHWLMAMVYFFHHSDGTVMLSQLDVGWRPGCLLTILSLHLPSLLSGSKPSILWHQVDFCNLFHGDRIKVLLLKHGENSSSNRTAQIWPDTICSPQRSKVDPASMNYASSDMWRVRGYSCMWAKTIQWGSTGIPHGECKALQYLQFEMHSIHPV